MRKQPNAPKKLPPKPVSTGAPSALDEVERALSVLDGRHPDFVRAERETREAARVREQTLKAERARAWRKRAKATMLSLALLGAIAAGGWFGFRVFSLARALSVALDAASAPFVGDGFAALASSNLMTPHKLEAQVAAQTCFVAVTSAPTGDMVVTHGATVTSHPHSIGWCACEAERVVVTAPAGAGPTQGLRLYTMDARVLGGPQGWGFASARPDALSPGGDECQESALVSWIADRRFPREAVDATWLERGAGARLSEAGFQAVAGSSVGRTFAVVEAMSGSCMFAMHPEANSQADPLVLEDMAGAALARGGSLLWCDLHGRALTVRGSGAASVLVVAAPASRVGGLLGAREWTARARRPNPATWVSEADLALDAANSLRASGLPDVTGSPLQQPQIRFVGLSMRTTKALVRDAPPRGTMLACAPGLESETLESVCAQVGPQPWLAAAGDCGLGGSANALLAGGPRRSPRPRRPPRRDKAARARASPDE